MVTCQVNGPLIDGNSVLGNFYNIVLPENYLLLKSSVLEPPDLRLDVLYGNNDEQCLVLYVIL